MKKKFLLNTVTSLLMQLTTVICGFVLPRLILEQYGSEVNGLTQSIKQFLGMITFLEMGVGQVIQSSLYKPLAQKDNEKISGVIASGSKFFRRIGLILLVYVAALMMFYPMLIDSRYDWLYTAGLIAAISLGSFAQYAFGIIDRVLLNADQRGYIQYTSQIVLVLLNTVAAAVMIQLGWSIHAVKLVSSLIFIARPVIIRLYIHKHYRIDRKIQYTGEPIKQKWNGIAQHISAVVLEGTDTIVLTLFSTLSNVSIYSVYFMVIAGVKQFYEAATAGLQSMVGAMWAKQELQELKKMFGCIETVLHFVVVFLFSCIGILMVPFVRVYTDGLTDTDYIQPLFSGVLVLAYAVRCLRTPYNILILAGGHYKKTQRCHIVAAALNLVISVVAVWLWGLVGIAVGTLVALAYQTVWMVIYDSKNLLKISLRDTLKQVGIDIATFGLIWLATYWISMPEVSYWGWLLMALPVGIIALTVTAVMAMLFYRQRLTDMIHWFTQKRNKE